MKLTEEILKHPERFESLRYKSEKIWHRLRSDNIRNCQHLEVINSGDSWRYLGTTGLIIIKYRIRDYHYFEVLRRIPLKMEAVVAKFKTMLQDLVKELESINE